MVDGGALTSCAGRRRRGGHRDGRRVLRRARRSPDGGRGVAFSPIADYETRNIETVLSGETEHLSPRTIAVVNNYDVRVLKVEGEFTRHSHPETDEFFLVLSGHLEIRMEDGQVALDQGDTFDVSRACAHQPYAESETTLLLFEPSETVNKGDTPEPADFSQKGAQGSPPPAL